MAIGKKRRKQVDRKKIAKKYGSDNTIAEVREKPDRRNISKTRMLFYAIIGVLMIAILVIAKNIVTLKIENGKLIEQEKELQGKKDELTAELQGVDDLDYIEEQARKLLKMIKPGEVLFILNGENPQPEKEEKEGSDTPTIPAPSGTVSQPQEEPEVVYTEPEYTEEEYVEEEVAEEEPEVIPEEGETEEVTEETESSEETESVEGEAETSEEEYTEETTEYSEEPVETTYESEEEG